MERIQDGAQRPAWTVRGCAARHDQEGVRRCDGDGVRRDAYIEQYAWVLPFNWSRYQHSVSPYTPSVILEMGYLSSVDDRTLMLDHPDTLASGIANGILQFLSNTPRSKI